MRSPDHAREERRLAAGRPGHDRPRVLPLLHRAHASGWEYALRWNMEGEFITYNSLYPGTDSTRPFRSSLEVASRPRPRRPTTTVRSPSSLPISACSATSVTRRTSHLRYPDSSGAPLRRGRRMPAPLFLLSDIIGRTGWDDETGTTPRPGIAGLLLAGCAGSAPAVRDPATGPAAGPPGSSSCCATSRLRPSGRDSRSRRRPRCATTAPERN